MNYENVKLVLDKIKSDPGCWDQTVWHLGCKHCFFGWAQILSGNPISMYRIRTDARIFLDMSFVDAEYFSSVHRTLKELESALDKKYDRDGYDRDGYNRSGYNRDGYNRDGYDQKGYRLNYSHNWDGYDRDGYDRDGYNWRGYNREGYHLDGYNRDGYNRDGYDRDELDRNNRKLPKIG